ncbi:MAG: hypothetical protein AMJ79_03835 [Phycisphaerae bacterium SM23_30]|nr:MAG: hypothetical protein AMJ79_03835 [Phycisphaerae bacterium SM23_30]
MSKSNDPKEILLDHLQDDKFRNTIRQWTTKVYSLAESFYTGKYNERNAKDLECEPEDIKLLVGDWRESYGNSLMHYSANSDFFERLPRPPIFTPDELFEELSTLIVDKIEEQMFLKDFNLLYNSFMDKVRSRSVRNQHSDSFDIWYFCNIPEEYDNMESRIGVLWKTNCIGLYTL